jgi:hypothetical protein
VTRGFLCCVLGCLEDGVVTAEAGSWASGMRIEKCGGRSNCCGIMPVSQVSSDSGSLVTGRDTFNLHGHRVSNKRYVYYRAEIASANFSLYSDSPHHQHMEECK